jgi:hypothetical protein
VAGGKYVAAACLRRRRRLLSAVVLVVSRVKEIRGERDWVTKEETNNGWVVSFGYPRHVSPLYTRKPIDPKKSCSGTA